MNLRPSGYEPDELPGCSTPRQGDVSWRERVYSSLVRSGGDLLSHVLRRSTISAVALNGRVRDGIGCFTAAMATRPEKRRFPSQAHRADVWCMTSDVVTVLPLPDQIKPVGRLVPVN